MEETGLRIEALGFRCEDVCLQISDLGHQRSDVWAVA